MTHCFLDSLITQDHDRPPEGWESEMVYAMILEEMSEHRRMVRVEIEHYLGVRSGSLEAFTHLDSLISGDLAQDTLHPQDIEEIRQVLLQTIPRLVEWQESIERVSTLESRMIGFAYSDLMLTQMRSWMREEKGSLLDLIHHFSTRLTEWLTHHSLLLSELVRDLTIDENIRDHEAIQIRQVELSQYLDRLSHSLGVEELKCSAERKSTVEKYRTINKN